MTLQWQCDSARPGIVGLLGDHGAPTYAALLGISMSGSAYLPLVRGMVPEFLSIFDVADPELVVGQRDVTTVASQALYMMNSPFVHERAAEMAQRAVASSSTDQARIDYAFRLAFGRGADAKEHQVSLAFLSEYENSLDASKPSPNRRQEAWTKLCHSLLASGEFRYTY